ncbi:MAG: ABC transporter [Gammaproteobacteria bacterium]|nr:ABC transporter [Gammaproteobacteria bacterium]|tara:strand:+ start:1975 stop:2907 length:933 start_codon:yes stop_codon:yes gene_type:complete
MNALKIRNLQKTYDNGNQALKGIDLTVDAGDFYALLGPNGAGKSTAIGIISSLINKSCGEVEIFGHNLDKDLEAAKSFVGLVPQEVNLNLWDTVLNIVINHAGYYGIGGKVARKRAEKYLRALHLWDRRKDVAMSLSGGMKRRLMIARALVHEPSLLILDEPTAGVDIEIRRSMWNYLQKINESGTTIILTTHYLEEAETLCRHIAIIDEGKIIEDARMSTVLRKIQREVLILNLAVDLKQAPFLEGFKVKLRNDCELEVEKGPNQNINNLFEQLDLNNIKVVSMRNKANRLEELFLRLVDSKNESESDL